MKLKTETRKILQFLAFLISLCVLFGYSILPSTAAFNDLYLPLIGRFWPTEQSPLLITEILNNPIGEDPAPEWIELYNRSQDPVDLSGWQLDKAVDFEFPAGTTLAAGEYLVVARDADIERRPLREPGARVFDQQIEFHPPLLSVRCARRRALGAPARG